MATYNKSQLSNVEMHSSLVCDVCNSDDIAQDEFGYIRKKCGVVLPIQTLQYHMLYNQDILQYAPLRNTQIGFKRERSKNPHFYQLERLNKVDSFKTNEENIELKASIEINRIFEVLSLPSSDKEEVLNNFWRILI